jgi:hypothetical protein
MYTIEAPKQPLLDSNGYTILKPSKMIPGVQCQMAEGMSKADAEHIAMCLNLYETVTKEETLQTTTN